MGLVGAGLQGKRRAQALKRSSETKLVVVADMDSEKAKFLADEMRCQATNNWKKVIEREDVELLLVCTPPNLHASMSIAALNKGKHVLCEKPLARNPDEAKMMVDAAQENGMKLKSGFNLRHHPAVRQARKWVDEGVIGELMFLRCRYGIGGREGYEKEWRANHETSGGGQLMDQGMHVIDLSRWFLGDFSEAVGFASTMFWNTSVEDNAFVLLSTKERQIASLHLSWTQWKNLFSFEIFGKEGYVIVEGLGGSYGVEKVMLGKRDFAKPFKEEIIEFRGEDVSWVEEWKEFVKAINENREPLGSGYDGWQAIKMAYAVYESARKGCVVKLTTEDKFSKRCENE